MNQVESMPCYIDGKLLHIAVAIQSKDVFTERSAVWDFVHSSLNGNLRNLPLSKFSLLSGIESLSATKGEIAFNKNELFNLDVFKHQQLLGKDYAALEFAMKRCEESLSKREFVLVAFPFYLGNGTLVTINDLDQRGRLIHPENLIEFGDFLFTKQALLSSAYWYSLLETRTLPLLEEGKKWVAASNLSEVEKWKFCIDVCTWGGRTGVASNLDKHKDSKQQLLKWLSTASGISNTSDAIKQGMNIKGLGASFASKHLRFIRPDKHATFDALLAQVVGLDLTADSYNMFIDLLHEIRKQGSFDDDIATLELSVFSLVKHFFDASAVLNTGRKYTATNFFSTGLSSDALEREFEQLEDFSPSLALYRRKNNPSVVAVSKKIKTGQDKHLTALLLTSLQTTQNETDSTVEPDGFSISHPALRPWFALEYLEWLLRSSDQQRISPEFMRLSQLESKSSQPDAGEV